MMKLCIEKEDVWHLALKKEKWSGDAARMLRNMLRHVSHAVSRCQGWKQTPTRSQHSVN